MRIYLLLLTRWLVNYLNWDLLAARRCPSSVRGRYPLAIILTLRVGPTLLGLCLSAEVFLTLSIEAFLLLNSSITGILGLFLRFPFRCLLLIMLCHRS